MFFLCSKVKTTDLAQYHKFKHRCYGFEFYYLKFFTIKQIFSRCSLLGSSLSGKTYRSISSCSSFSFLLHSHWYAWVIYFHFSALLLQPPRPHDFGYTEPCYTPKPVTRNPDIHRDAFHVTRSNFILFFHLPITSVYVRFQNAAFRYFPKFHCFPLSSALLPCFHQQQAQIGKNFGI